MIVQASAYERVEIEEKKTTMRAVNFFYRIQLHSNTRIYL